VTDLGTTDLGAVRIGWFAGADAVTLDDAVGRTARAVDEGFAAVWFPQTASLDALTALAVVAREVPGPHLGTAVVPVQGRHPIPLALSALTVADAAGPGRFTFGIGATHRPVSEGWFGIPYRGIVDVCAETLDAVNGLFSETRTANVEGTTLTARVTTSMPTPAPSVMLAALGPRMVALAGAHSDGSITWMTGPRELARLVDGLREAATGAGRPAPRVVVGIPVCLTDDVPGTSAALTPQMEGVARMPSYARQVANEGVEHPVDVVVMGDEGVLRARLAELAAVGMTELCAHVVGSPQQQQDTRRFLGALSSTATSRTGNP
jgi:F420-dependent oxidoreductase-like protein